VHHRVKNNLQTISSLLSLQARRVEEGSAREALREAERRVRSIALVHEILSRDPGEQVPFDDIVASLVQMAVDSIVSSQSVGVTVSGDLGEVSAKVATPLAVALAELLQNAVEHAFAPPLALPEAGERAPSEDGHVVVTLAHEADELVLEVRDDGCGLPPGFDIERSTSLGLSIVRDLVSSQLDGAISMQRVATDAGGGTRVLIRVPAR
jgi:two-component sensor histidine kinase